MKKSDIFLVIALVAAMSMFVVAVWNASITARAIEEVKETQVEFHTTNHYGMTTDAVQYKVDCTWIVDHPITEDEALKIDILIRKTIAKSFQYYSNADIYDDSDKIMNDLRNRIQDVVFVIEPNGFAITQLCMHKHS